MKDKNIQLTKIIATLGPESEKPEIIEKLIKSGVDVFRFNLKHNTLDWHQDRITRVNNIAQKLGIKVAILVDLQGPELRASLPTDQIRMKTGEKLKISKSLNQTDEQSIAFSHPQAVTALSKGQAVYIDDKAFSFRVIEEDKELYLEAQESSLVQNQATINLPNLSFPFNQFLEKDIQGLGFCKSCGVDFVALSFIRNPGDIKLLKKTMRDLDVKAGIVAKIETRLAVDDLEPIIREAQAVMVARGDLGVEFPVEQVPFFQKKIIGECIRLGKPVITATEMLQSMISSSRPTRAEVSDVANATYDFSDALMLSAETATGKYPQEAVDTMCRIVKFHEKKINSDIRKRFDFTLNDQTRMICNAAYDLYLKSSDSKDDIAGFLVFTETGRVAQILSMYKPKLPIFAVCPTKEVADRLLIHYGIFPLVHKLSPKSNNPVTHIKAGIEDLLERELANEKQRLIVIHADIWDRGRYTSTVKLIGTGFAKQPSKNMI